MKKSFFILFSITALSQPVCANTTNFEIGTLGVGISQSLSTDGGGSVSFGYNTFGGRFESVSLIDTADMNVDLKWRSIGIAVERDIPNSNFQVAFGIRYKLDDIRLDGVPEGQFTVLGQVLEARDYATLDGEVTFNKIAPTIAVSYRNELASGWNVDGSLGLMFQGEPDVVLRPSGPLSSLPEFQAQLARDEAYIEDKLSNLAIFPVISVGLSYRF